MQDWAARPLDAVYAAIGVSLGGHRDVLGLWTGPGGGGAEFFDVRAD